MHVQTDLDWGREMYVVEERERKRKEYTVGQRGVPSLFNHC